MEASSHVVPYFDFKAAPEGLRAEWKRALSEVVESGVYIRGPHVDSFERAWADRVGASGCVGVANGLDALTLALRALGIGRGDSVAVPAHTFIATWLAVIAVGATPVGVDVDSRGLIDLDQLEQAATGIDAVIPVHLHGGTVDMERLTEWASKKSILVLEDCAQAHGAETAGKPVGSWGDAAAFSFYPTKNLGALGDAGAVTSRDQRVLESVRLQANYGADPGDKYRHIAPGCNSRLDPMQAAVLEVNLRHLDEWTRRRRQIAEIYLEALAQRPDLGRPLYNDATSSVWHHFIVLTTNREALAAHLLASGVHTDVHYPNPASDEVARFTSKSTPVSDFNNAREFSARCLSLPLHQWMSDNDARHVATALTSAPTGSSFNAQQSQTPALEGDGEVQ